MAVDFLLLQRYPTADARFRHYSWRRPAFTFGYSQKLAFVREQLPVGESFDLCRRPTGGGIVDHRDDWTYALVIPRGHRLEELRATESYRLVHEALACALREQGVAAKTKPCAAAEGEVCDESGNPSSRGRSPLRPECSGERQRDDLQPGVCFQRAEIYDVVSEATGAKIAGAAQKRNKHGLLFQGSIWRPAAGAIDWDEFETAFVRELGAVLRLGPAETGWPELNEDELEGLTEQYSAEEWLSFR